MYCRTCRGPVQAGFARCYQCDLAHARCGGLLADVVAPVAYAVKGGRLAGDLWRYKSGAPGAAEAGTRLAAMLARYLREHGPQVWRAAGMAGGPELAAVVPSGQGRAGPHPLLGIATSCVDVPIVPLSFIVDREDDLGGTWYVNRYPGLAVDVPTTTYSYWFEPNPNWSRLFSTGAEIKQYADDIADKYGVRRHIRFNTAVEGARWDEDSKVWRVALADGETLTARYLVTATGFLSQPQTPDIPGIGSFAGKVIHTAAWDDGHDLENRRVGLIGTGATAVQLIPEVAKKAADLTVYQRTPIWVVPPARSAARDASRAAPVV